MKPWRATSSLGWESWQTWFFTRQIPKFLCYFPVKRTTKAPLLEGSQGTAVAITPCLWASQTFLTFLVCNGMPEPNGSLIWSNRAFFLSCNGLLLWFHSGQRTEALSISLESNGIFCEGKTQDRKVPGAGTDEETPLKGWLWWLISLKKEEEKETNSNCRTKR